MPLEQLKAFTERTMLILTRRVGESIKIGDEVTVTLLDMKGGQVRIGIAAPRAVAVHRNEVHERILAGELRDRPPLVRTSSV